MEVALEFIQANVTYAPYIIFGLLLLAGFNLPVSEDLMLFTSALLATKNPELTPHLFISVFLGIYFSDLICYAVMGRYLGNKIFQIKFFANMVTQKKIDQVTTFYRKYGIAVLIVGRFIPFGVRNALFITAGLGKMNAWRFSLADLLACTISSTVFFYLYYTFGEAVIIYIKQSNIIIFSFFATGLLGWFIYRKIQSQRGHKASQRTP